MVLGMKVTPTFPIQILWPSQNVGETTSTMNSEILLENYGKITILLVIQVELRYSPPGHIQMLSLPKGLTIWIFPSTLSRKQTMNLSSIVGFVICLTGTTSMIMTMVLLLLIRMKDILLVMIQIESIPRNCSQTLQNSF